MSIYELKNSRLGNTGDSGTEFSTQWIVTLDSSTSNPDFISPLSDPDLPKKGQGHPYYENAFVTSLSIDQQINDFIWKVSVHYSSGSSSIVPEVGPSWRLTVSGSVHTETIYTEPEGSHQGRTIGRLHYVRIHSPPDTSPANATHIANAIDQDGNQQTIWLKQLTEAEAGRVPTGMQVSQPRATLVLSKTIQGEPKFAKAYQRLATLNKTRFFGAEPRTVRFDSVNMSTAIPETGFTIAYDVTLNFTYNRDGWDLKEFDTWNSERGDAEILDPDTRARVERTHVGYKTSNFFTLLSEL